jgi:hypothetical protein
MSSLVRAFLASLLLAGGAGAAADSPDCDRERIAAHVRLEFEIYGPLSAEVEYFGFIFHDGERYRSAVVRSRKCHEGNCLIQVDAAGAMIPKGARVFGEWHTHPHDGAPQLSEHDVRGAYRNRHLRCYLAFYSNPDGEIFAWSPAQSSVPTAMASRSSIGTYGDGSAILSTYCEGVHAGQRDRRLVARSASPQGV